MITEAKKKAAEKNARPTTGEPGQVSASMETAGESRPTDLRERYLDDGSLTCEDQEKFSLGKGKRRTSTLDAAGSRGGGSGMDDEAMLGDIPARGESRKFGVVIALVALALVGTLVFLLVRGEDADASKSPEPPSETSSETSGRAPSGSDAHPPVNPEPPAPGRKGQRPMALLGQQQRPRPKL